MHRPLRVSYSFLKEVYILVHLNARSISRSQNKRFLLGDRMQHLRRRLRRMLPISPFPTSGKATCKSASIQIIASPFASLNPLTTALLNPLSVVLTMILILYPSLLSTSTSSTLPSRELSSTTINSTFSALIGDSESLNAAKRRVVRGLKLSFSLYAGTMTECVILASEADLVGVLAERVRFDIFK